MLSCVGQRTHVLYQAPNVIRCLEFAEGGHPCEPDSVLENPKELLVRIALYLLTGEICCSWVHPSPRRRLGAAINPMTYAAIQAVMRTSSFNAGICVDWSRRNSLAARSANDELLGQIRDACFKRPGFRQRRQSEMHQSSALTSAARMMLPESITQRAGKGNRYSVSS
jgi:hypothetical protein